MGFKSLLGLETSEELRKKLDSLQKALEDVERNNKVLETRTALFRKYEGLFDEFKRDVLEARRSQVAHERMALRNLPDDRDHHERLSGRYDELTDLLKTRFQVEEEHEAAMEAKLKILEGISETQKLLEQAGKAGR